MNVVTLNCKYSTSVDEFTVVCYFTSDFCKYFVIVVTQGINLLDHYRILKIVQCLSQWMMYCFFQNIQA